MYIAITLVSFCLAWLIVKQRRWTRSVLESRDHSYQQVFQGEAMSSKRGRAALELCRLNPRVATDRDHFVNLCHRSGVKPELAARAWVERALAAGLRHKPF